MAYNKGPTGGTTSDRLRRLIRERGVSGLARSIAIRVRIVLHWLIALPLFTLHLIVHIVVLPFRHLHFGVFPTERIGHLDLNPEVYSRQKALARSTHPSKNISTYFIAGKPANEQLLKMWQRTMTIIRFPTLHALLRTTQTLWARSPFFEPLAMLSNEYLELNITGPTLAFTPEEYQRGFFRLKELGINLDNDWYTCVFARDAHYLSSVSPYDDWSYHDHRNADVDSFIPAIELIVSQGGHVIRVGSCVSKPLALKSDRVIDYSIQARDDFMDIFIVAHCRFFLGTTSGIADLAMIFDRPRLSVNSVPFGWAPFGKKSLFIPKLLCNSQTGELYSFSHVLRVFHNRHAQTIWDGRLLYQQGHRHIDNSPEEILEATIEMLELLNGINTSTAEDEQLQKRYRMLLAPDHWCAQITTPMCKSFLNKYQKLI